MQPVQYGNYVRLGNKACSAKTTPVGYSGGDVRNATYPNHGSHGEAIEIIFDPQKQSFRQLLEYSFRSTTLNRQGYDRGASYRFAIFCTSEEHKPLRKRLLPT